MNIAQKIFILFWIYILAHVPVGFIDGRYALYWACGDLVTALIIVMIYFLWIIYDDLGD